MLNIFTLFINKILTFGNLKLSDIPHKARKELLTAFKELQRLDTVFIPEFIKVAKRFKGRLIIDDTNDSGKNSYTSCHAALEKPAPCLTRGHLSGKHNRQ